MEPLALPTAATPTTTPATSPTPESVPTQLINSGSETKINFAALYQKYCVMLGKNEVQGKSGILKLLSALPITAELPTDITEFEPSGLAEIDGALYTVNDKNDARLYKLECDGTTCKAVKAIDIDRKQLDSELQHKKLDFEGLVPAGDKGFIVINEATGHPILVDKKGNATVVSMPADPKHLQTVGNGLESVAIDSKNNRIIVIKERGQRIFYSYPLDPKTRTNNAPTSFQVESALVEEPYKDKKIGPSASDALMLGGFLYVLERESACVLKIDISKPTPKLVDVVSYATKEPGGVETTFATGQPFGIAEGLTITCGKIYIVTDNNGKPVYDNLADNRPRLCTFERPKGF